MAETMLVTAAAAQADAAAADRPDLAAPRYTFRGACADLQSSTAGELVVAGPAGTGKSLACLWKLHVACARYPGIRCLIARRWRESLTETALVTFEQHVLPPGSGISDGAGRKNRHSYRYPNGSEIIVGGLDKPTRFMSSEYELVYVQEAIELDEAAWELLSTRLARRADKMPYNQLLGDTNPEGPQHWLKRRASGGTCRMLESRHEDNPALYDAAAGTWTAAGSRYLAILDALTGPRRARLRHGLWVQAEGVVYEGFDPAIHVIDRFPIPRDWPRYWSVDFGFVNPFVCQRWAMDSDGRLYLYAETYRTQRLVEDHGKALLDELGVRAGNWTTASEPRPKNIVSDHDAEDRATFERYVGMGTTAAVKDVSPGIQAVAARLRKAGDGKPRLFIFRDALTSRDADLYAARKPTCTADEFPSYVWDVRPVKGVAGKEQPVKAHDHGLDAARYLVYWLDRAASGRYAKTTAPARTWVDDGPGVWGQ